MAELKRTDRLDGLYGRLQQRLIQALAEADKRARLYRRSPQELELRGLSSAELALIQAYREQNLQWLRGWHAAAEELAFLERLDEGATATPVARPAPAPRLKPLLRRQTLSCALCGEPVRKGRGGKVPPCLACGSRLFRSGSRC